MMRYQRYEHRGDKPGHVFHGNGAGASKTTSGAMSGGAPAPAAPVSGKPKKATPAVLTAHLESAGIPISKSERVAVPVAGTKYTTGSVSGKSSGVEAKNTNVNVTLKSGKSATLPAVSISWRTGTSMTDPRPIIKNARAHLRGLGYKTVNTTDHGFDVLST